MPTRPSCDILGLGSVSMDEILLVDDWPPADVKRRIRSREIRLGGLTGHALVTATRLGARCEYGGRLGSDADSVAVTRELHAARIGTEFATIDQAFGVVRSTIVAAAQGATRNVFSHPAALTGAHDSQPSADLLQTVPVLFVDHHGITGSIRAVRLVRAAGHSVVADLERDDHPEFRQLLDSIDHLILSRDFACRICGTEDPASAVASLWNANREVVIVTCGGEGGYYRAKDNSSAVMRYPVLPVEPRDTTGCGDVFHGAYAAALAKADPLRQRIATAAVAAGIKAAGGIPDLASVSDRLGSFTL